MGRPFLNEYPATSHIIGAQISYSRQDRRIKLKILAPLILTSTIAACAVPVGDIRWKPELLSPGDYVSVDQSRSGLIHHMYKGRQGNDYLIESYRGPSPTGTPAFTTRLDGNGNYLSWQRSDGYEVRYQPHDCTRTLGKCRYTEIRPNDERIRWTRITTATDTGFKYVETDRNGERRVSGEIAIDERGIAGSGQVSGHFGAQTFTLVE
ncbi:hypothetical protein CLV80_101189 [Yoonia maritima]|uniref:Uncharacterized protein n=1 Tax=Yoonia maritima TaxID=1435347 RepID=A0A2T0W4E7_9RHOB|nr:hypothetical protein CLV80_101189 [Yoonia maritima]